MEFTNTFTIPVGIDEAFATLTDLEKVAPCMPGAKLETVDGDVYTGKVKVKVGPMSLTYRGTAEITDRDAEQHTATIAARGSEARGGGTANADVTAALVEVDDGTQVTVETTLDITGKPAQFGRGVMGDVGRKIIDSFAECLSRTLDSTLDDADEATGDDGDGTDGVGDDESDEVATDEQDGAVVEVAPTDGDTPVDAPSGATPAQAAAAAQQAVTASGPRRLADTEPEVEALDLMDVAGGSVARRVLPVIGVATLVALVVWLFSRGGDDPDDE